jgi:hypothetical protein
MKMPEQVESMVLELEEACGEDPDEEQEAIRDALLWVLDQRTDRDIQGYWKEKV